DGLAVRVRPALGLHLRPVEVPGPGHEQVRDPTAVRVAGDRDHLDRLTWDDALVVDPGLEAGPAVAEPRGDRPGTGRLRRHAANPRLRGHRRLRELGRGAHGRDPLLVAGRVGEQVLGAGAVGRRPLDLDPQALDGLAVHVARRDE